MGFSYGYITALTASLLWSINPGLINKLAKNINSLLVNFSRNLYGALMVLTVILLYGGEPVIDYTGLLIVYISALAGPLLGDVSYIYSIKRIGGGNAVAIGYTYIFYAQFFSAILYGEKISLNLGVGTIIALLGVYIVYSGEKHVIDKKGFLAAITASISWGLGATLSKAALQYGDPLQVAFYRNLFVTLTLLPFIHNELKIIRSRELLILGVITGGLGFGAGMPLFLYAVKTIGVSATALTTALTPVLGRVFARIIAGEKPSVKAYIGTLVTIIGIIIGLNITG